MPLARDKCFLLNPHQQGKSIVVPLYEKNSCTYLLLACLEGPCHLDIAQNITSGSPLNDIMLLALADQDVEVITNALQHWLLGDFNSQGTFENVYRHF